MSGINVESTGSIPRDITIKLAVISRQMRKRFDRSARDLGVTRSQWGLIAYVARHSGSTQRSIAEALEVSEASIGRLVERMCAEGFLTRRQDSSDARAYQIFLAEKAETIVTTLSVIADEEERVIFAGLSEDELRQLNQTLGKMHKNISSAVRACLD